MNRRFVAAFFAFAAVGCGPSPRSDELAVEDDVGAQLSLSEAEFVAIPDSDVTLALWRSQGAFALKKGTAPLSRPTRTRFDLLFRDEPARDPLMRRVTGESSLWLVQFYSVALPEMLAALTKFGGEAIAPFPLHAYVMRLSPKALEAARAARFVRAVEPFEARHRYESRDTGRYLIRASSQRPEITGTLVAQLQALGATVHLETIHHYALMATMTPRQVAEAAQWGEVLHIDPWSAPERDMDKVRIISGANFLEQAVGFTGTGVRAEVMDGNVNEAHADLAKRGLVFHGPHAGDASHGTATTGIVFGDGTANAAARGLMPTGQPIFASYDTFVDATADRKAHTAELTKPPYEAVLQSNSWGSGLTKNYTNVSAEMDTLIFDLDFLIFNSMSNTGNQNARPQAWAKNVVSIGGVYHYDTLDTADDRWDRSGTIGPASDGRLKPDLAHFWDNVLAPASNGSYTQFGGTSAATPITAGYAGLVMQMWSAGVFGNPTPGATVFENRPHFSTAKAMLINSATQWLFNGADHDLTRTHQGWGRVDVARLYELRNSIFVVNETRLLTQGQTERYEFTVAAGRPEFRATLTWADPAAVPSAGLHRVNDLTLKVTAPDGTVYFGNNGLEGGVFSTAGGTANIKDTVENVFIGVPPAGVWVVEVRADELAQDGHVETAEVDADFALVVSGIERVDTSTPPTVQFTAPAPNATVAREVVIAASATSTTSLIAKVRFGLPDGTFVDDVEAPYQATFDTRPVANGPATLTAIATDANGATSLPSTLEVTVENLACADGRVVATGLPLAIPDNNTTGVSVPLVVGGEGQLTSVSISLRITHSYRGDLIVQLISPTGQIAELARRVGGQADDLVLTDVAVSGLSGGAKGTWLLKVIDAASIDVGSVDTASLAVATDCQR